MGKLIDGISSLFKKEQNQEGLDLTTNNKSAAEEGAMHQESQYSIDDRSWVKDFLLKALHELNVNCEPTLEIDEETGEPLYYKFNFEFQAGKFSGTLKIDMNVLHFSYPYLLSISEDYFMLVPILANEFNKDYQEYKLIYNEEPDEDHEINIHAKAGLAIYSPEYDAFKKQLVHFLTNFFYFSREIVNRYHELMKELEQGNNINNKNLIYNEQGNRLIQESEKWLMNSKTTYFGPDIAYHLLEDELDINVYALKRIFIMDGVSEEKEEMVFPTDEELISIAQSHKNGPTSILFTFGSKDLESDNLEEEVFATLEPLPEQNNYSRVRANFTVIPAKGHHTRPLCPIGEPEDNRSISLVLTQNNMSKANQQSEFDYVWEELQQKLNKDEDKELTETETIISAFSNKALARSSYWTAKSFYMKDAYQTIRHGLEAFRILSESYYNTFNENGDKEEGANIMDIFQENCMMLGTSYYEVGAYKMAMHFFDYPISDQYAPDRIIEPYILTLLAQHHHSSIKYIEDSIKRVKNMLNSLNTESNGDDDDNDSNEKEFDVEYVKELDKIILPQYQILAFIDQRFYAHAKKELLNMIADPDFSDFAFKQLDIIEKLAPGIEPEK